MHLDTRNRKEIISRRREAVGQLRAKGLTIREIVKRLPELSEPIVDESGRPWCRATICTDLKALRKEWDRLAQVHIGEHIARQLAEIQEAKREARQVSDLNAWARLLGLEMKLLGTDAPQKFEDWSERDWREYAQEHGLSEAEVIEEAERIIAETKSGRAVPAADGAAGGAPADVDAAPG